MKRNLKAIAFILAAVAAITGCATHKKKYGDTFTFIPYGTNNYNNSYWATGGIPVAGYVTNWQGWQAIDSNFNYIIIRVLTNNGTVPWTNYIGFFGNGIGITNLPTTTVTFTNFIDGQLYTNGSGRWQYITSEVCLTNAAVSGDTAESIEIAPQGSTTTNFRCLSISASLTIAAITNELSCYISNTMTYCYTNRSIGAGNKTGLVPGTGQIIQY